MGLDKHNDDKAMQAEINKAKLWEFLYFNPEQPTDVMLKTLKFTSNQMMHYVRFMLHRKYITRKKVKINGVSRYVYSAGIEYETELYKINRDKPNQQVEEGVVELAREARLIQNATRVVKLLDNPLKPAPESKKKKTTINIGSGMSLFNSY